MQYHMKNNQEAYLQASCFIDTQHPNIIAKAKQLKGDDAITTAKNCFEFVRDQIQHSMDSKQDGFSCKASDVLANGHGFCYAKSHLLTALLRANGLYAGLCYQRLTLSDFPEEGETLTYCLHGLVAVHLPELPELTSSNGWYRIDPRGNKKGVNAQFTPPTEQLAFDIKSIGEKDFFEVFAEPIPSVLDVLTTYSKHQEICSHLPDAVTLSV